MTVCGPAETPAMQRNNAVLQDLAFRLILSVKLLIYTLKNIDSESWRKITKRRFFSSSQHKIVLFAFWQI